MQNNILWFEYGLTIVAIILLVKALIPVREIIHQLQPLNTSCWASAGNARCRWKILSVFIILFIIGYLLYIIVHASHHVNTIGDMVIPWILFGGAIFVFMVCSLSVKTANDLRKIYILEQESLTDPLMGIYNRRYLDRRLSEETQRAIRYEVPFSIFLLDIDHFKQANDTYGHQIGDLVLKKLGAVIVNAVREPDIVVRYGGEEILVILPSTNITSTVDIAERLRQIIAATMMVGPDLETEQPQATNTQVSSTPEMATGSRDGMAAHVQPAPRKEKERPAIYITVSIGVAGYRFSDVPDSAELIINRADQALYQAKEQGRNRVISSNGNDDQAGVVSN